MNDELALIFSMQTVPLAMLLQQINYVNHITGKQSCISSAVSPTADECSAVPCSKQGSLSVLL